MRSSRRVKAILAGASVLAIWGPSFGATDTWTGAVAANSTYPTGTALWDTATANWVNGGSGVYTNGDSVVFTDNFAGNSRVALPANTYPASVEFEHTGAGATNYVLLSTWAIANNGYGAGLTGTSVTPWGSTIETPPPTLVLDAGFNGSVEMQARAGGVADAGYTTVDGGTLILDDAGALPPFAGSNPQPNGAQDITLGGGTIEINVTTADDNNTNVKTSQLGGVLTVIANSTIENSANVLNAPSGAPHVWNGSINFMPGTTLYFNSLGSTEDWLNASVNVVGGGNATMSLGATNTVLTFETNKPGSAAVTYDLGTGSGILRNRLPASGTITLGALTGGASTKLEGSETTSTTTVSTYAIGALNLTNTTFQGTIIDNGVGVTAINKVGTGTLTLTNAGNAYSGGTTVTQGTLLGTQATGTPVGVGNITVNGGALDLAPAGSGSAVTLTGATAVAGTSTATIGSEFTYGGGGTLALNRGTQNSLTFDVGNSGDVAGQGTVIISRSGRGTLVIAPAGGTAATNLGVNEIFEANSTASGVYPSTVNGIVNTSIVGQNNDANESGDFLSYNTSNGFVIATYGDTNFAAPSATTVELVNAAQTLSGSTNVFALNASANINVGSNTLTVGNNAQSPQAGLILNGSTISGTGALAFGASEGTVYTSAANGTISVPITGNGGLTAFGPGTLTLSANNAETGTTNVQAGTLILSGDNTGNSTASTNVATGATLQLQANAGNTTSGINRALSTTATQLQMANNSTLQLRADSATTFVDLPTGTVSNFSMNANSVTIDVNQLTNAGSNVVLSFDPNGFTMGGGTINVTGGNGYSLALPTITDATNTTVDWIEPTTASVTVAGFVSNVTNSSLGLAGSGSGTVTGLIANGTGAAGVATGGTATWTLTAANTYSGGTVLNGGVLVMGNSSAVGTSTVTFEGGTLQYTMASGAVDLSTTNKVALADGYAANIDTNGLSVTFASPLVFFPAHPGKTGGLTKLGAGTLSLTGTNTYFGLTTVNGGSLVLGVTGAVLSGNSVANNAGLEVAATNTLGNVSGTGTTTVDANATLTVGNFTQGGLVNNGITQVNGTGTVGPISGTGTLTIGTGTSNNSLHLAMGSGASSQNVLNIAAGSSLDVSNNHVFINYGSGTDPISSVQAWLASGYAGGAWNGAGINTSAPLVVGGLSYGLGYADSADTGNPAGLSSGQIEVKYTLLGDADLNGIVNGLDFGILAANFNKGVTGWDKGDFDYNNIVNGIDFGALAANFNKGAAGASVGVPAYEDPAIMAFAAANGLLADVPEPASVGLLALGAVGILARRRRRSEQ